MAEQEALLEEARRIESDALYTSQTNFVQAVFYRRLHYVLGTSAVIAAGLASASVLAEWSDVLTGLAAVLATILTAIQTFVNPERQWIEHNWQGTEYRDLQHQARRFRTIEATSMGDEECREKLQQLAKRQTDLNRQNRPSERAFKTAQKKLAAGDALHTGDQALMLTDEPSPRA